METREILKKADKGTLTWEKVDGGKIRFTSLGWDDAVVTKPNEVLEIAMLDTIPALVKATMTRPIGSCSASPLVKGVPLKVPMAWRSEGMGGFLLRGRFAVNIAGLPGLPGCRDCMSQHAINVEPAINQRGE